METGRIKKIIFTFSMFFLFSFSVANGATLTKPVSNLGLQLYYSFDEGTSTVATDFSGNKRSGTLQTMSHPATASSGWGNGKFGKALNFDGIDDNVLFSGLTLGTTHTVSMWIKPNGGIDYQGLITDSNGFNGLFYMGSTGKINFFYPSIDNQNTTGLTSGVWTHVVAVVNSGTITFYINGVSNGTAGSIPGYTPINIGSAQPFSSEDFTGSIDEVRVYSRALSVTEVRRLYEFGSVKFNSSENNLVKDGLVGYWTFNSSDMISSTVYDKSGNNNTGTFAGTAISSAKTMGKLGQALSFNGSDREIDINDNASLNLTTSFTVSAWIKRESTNWSPIYDSSTSGGWSVQISDTNKITYTEPGVNDYMGTSNVSNSVWQHIVVVKNGDGASNTTFYLNGVLDATASTDTVSTPTGQKRIGYDGSFFFNGSIDDVRVYNRALSLSEIKALYLAGESKINTSQNDLGQSTLNSGLVDLLSFNSKDFSDRVYDRSSSANHGYVYNSATGTSKTIGKVGQGILFDGVNDFVLQDLTSVGSLTRGTVSLWVYRTRNSSYEILAEDTVSNVSIEGDNPLSLWIANSCQTLFSTVTLNEWVHLTATWDGTTNRTYVNGVQSNANACGSAPSALTRFSVGARFNGSVTSENFSGKIDELRIYNRALTAAEVKQLYLSGK